MRKKSQINEYSDITQLVQDDLHIQIVPIAIWLAIF
jgi:hypothetical protein